MLLLSPGHPSRDHLPLPQGHTCVGSLLRASVPVLPPSLCAAVTLSPASPGGQSLLESPPALRAHPWGADHGNAGRLDWVQGWSPLWAEPRLLWELSFTGTSCPQAQRKHRAGRRLDAAALVQELEKGEVKGPQSSSQEARPAGERAHKRMLGARGASVKHAEQGQPVHLLGLDSPRPHGPCDHPHFTDPYRDTEARRGLALP